MSQSHSQSHVSNAPPSSSLTSRKHQHEEESAKPSSSNTASGSASSTSSPPSDGAAQNVNMNMNLNLNLNMDMNMDVSMNMNVSPVYIPGPTSPISKPCSSAKTRQNNPNIRRIKSSVAPIGSSSSPSPMPLSAAPPSSSSPALIHRHSMHHLPSKPSYQSAAPLRLPNDTDGELLFKRVRVQDLLNSSPRRNNRMASTNAETYIRRLQLPSDNQSPRSSQKTSIAATNYPTSDIFAHYAGSNGPGTSRSLLHSNFRNSPNNRQSISSSSPLLNHQPDEHRSGGSYYAIARTLSQPQNFPRELPQRYAPTDRSQAINHQNSNSPSTHQLHQSSAMVIGSEKQSSPSQQEGEQPQMTQAYPCDFPGCHRKFMTANSRMIHQRRAHAPPTAFVCKYCNSSFSTSPNLNKHIKSVHEKLKPFTCTQCSSSFAFKDGLQRHVRMVHDIQRPFSCKYCTIRFKTRNQMNKHVWSKHPQQYIANSGYIENDESENQNQTLNQSGDDRLNVTP